jgi:O-succinylbenzoic acid--CoA ligase
MSLSIVAAARDVGDRPALIAGGAMFGFEELASRAQAAAAEIAARAGDRPVAVVADRRVDTAIALYALLELGRAGELVHPRLTASERAPLTAGHLVLDERWIAPSAGARAPSVAPPDDRRPAFLLATSGTSGPAKHVILTRRNLRASADASAAVLGWRDDDRWLAPIPLAHVGGLSVLTRCLIARRCAVLGEPHALADAVARHAVTLASVVPTLLARLTEPHRLRAVLVGGAACPPRLLAEARARGIPALATYGMTEACSQIATERAPSDGLLPLPGMEVRISAESRVQIRGPAVMAGYAGERPRRDDDWVDTGDLGALDARGALAISGRADDLIITGGENVHPAEIEAVALERRDIAAACAVGLADETWGAIVALGVVAGGGVDLRALAALLAERLAPHKRPRRLAVLDALPTTAGGKPDRGRARKLIQALSRAMPPP